jgi:diguanylate cyclase (GGDEF)-like protein/PAS domain S-box-containing protein
MVRQRRAGLLVLLVLGSGLLSAQISPAGDQPLPPIRRVLILNDQNSFSPTRAFVDYEIQGSTTGSKYRIEVDHEYLDVPQIPSETEQKLVRDFMIRKYRNRRPDVIITLGAAALRFMAEEHRRQFAGIPMVYCFPNGAEKDLKPDPEITGATMSLDAASTMRAALHMLPDTRHVFVITGTAAYDLAQIQPVKKQLEDFSSRVDITYLVGLAMPELLKRLNGLPKDSIVLYCTHSRDGAGTFFDFQQNGSLINAAANAPVFTLIDVQIGYGQVGGYLAQTKEEGTIAGRDALKILDGVKPSDIPVATVPNSFVFDWPALKRWGIKDGDLPPGSDVLNRPPSPWELFKGYIIGGLSLMLLEALLIAGLLLQSRMRREAENRLRTIFDGAIEGIYRTTPEGKYLVANPAQARILGYSSAEDLIASVNDLAHEVWFDPEERAMYRRALDERGEVRGFACRFKRKDGEIVWFSLNCKRVTDASGRTLYYEGFVEEITRQKRSEMELQEREERLKQAEMLAQMGYTSWNVDTNTSTWSEGMYRVTGRDPTSPPPRHEDRARIYAPESWARLNEAVQHALATGEPYELELQFIRPDGSLRWARAQGQAVRNDIGRVHRLIGTLQDITEQKLSEMTLRDSEERFRATFEQAAVGIIHVSFEGQILRCNQRFAEFLGYSPEEIAGKSFQQFTPPEYQPGSKKILDELGAGDIGEEGFEKPYIRQDGSLIWVRLNTSIQRDGKGQPLHLVTFVEDITDRKSAEEHLAAASKELRASEVRHRTVFQTSLDALNISRLNDGKLVDVNKTFLDLTGFQRSEVIGRTTVELGIWVNPSERQGIIDELRSNSSIRDTEVLFRKKDGNTFWGLTSASVIEFDGVPHVLVATRDLSDAKDALKTIRELAFYDSLTHLPNRRSLLDLLGKTHDADPRVRALLFVDLDHFKSLNDALGHYDGDLLLQETARRISSCILGEGTVARLGGDEFVVVLENLGNTSEHAADQAKQIGERILAAVSHPYLEGERECHFTSSIGITVFGTDLDSGLEALQQGEIAMSKAKEAGRNTIRFFSPELQANVNARVLMENELRKAIRAAEFVLYFQPQVRGGRLIGSEALIRWNHPQRGILAPGAFIELAEDTGLILPLGNWVFFRACEQVAAWAGKNPSGDAPVAVNISGKQFSQPDFVARVLSTLDLTGANPANIKLELTETSLVMDFQDAVAKMTELKSHGLKFSVDDFGTGYSSLAYLKSLPLDQLKIDRAFVKDILVDGPSGAIAQAIISMGHSMGFSVIAEGVENEEQRDFLIGIGCDCFQGYLYSRPVPADELERIWFL